MKDQFGRDIDYLRISLTDRCNLRCVYCMPEEGVKSRSHCEILSFEEIARVVNIASHFGVKYVRFTGGEPLVRKGMVDVVRQVSQMEGIEDVSLTTNGILLPLYAERLKDAGLSRVNISLDTLNGEQYRHLTRCGSLDDAWAGVEAALDAGFDPVKLNTVVIRSMDQDLLAFAKLTKDHPLHVRFIEYMPLGSSCSDHMVRWKEDEVIPLSELFETVNVRCKEAGLGELEPLTAPSQASSEAPIGWGPARYWKLPDALGSIGFITSVSEHFCAQCNRLRLTADGKLRMCLFSDDELDVRAALRNGTDEDIERLFLQALQQKPESHGYALGTARKMVQMGG